MLLLLRLDFWLGTPAMGGRLGIALGLLALLLSTLAAGELVSLWTTSAHRPNRRVVIPAVLMMVLISLFPTWLHQPLALAQSHAPDSMLISYGVPLICSFVGLIVAFVFTICVEMFQFKTTSAKPGVVADRVGRATLIYVYLSMLFGFLIPHRWLENDNAIGLISLIALIATVKLSDSFAYFAGKSLGTIKLAPNLSPKKTVQGAGGAVIGGCVASAIVVFVVAPMIFGIQLEKPWWWFLLYGLAVTGAGMVGDLAESLLKRDADCKDSSAWLPGLGGVLDVLDSLVFAAPISYFLWMIG